MKLNAIIVDCKVNKEEVVHNLTQLTGVKQVYLGGSKIAIAYEPDKEESIIRSMKPLSGVKNAVIGEVEVETIPAVKIPGDREGWFSNGVKLPKDLTDKKVEEVALTECTDDFCTMPNTELSPIPNSIKKVDEDLDDIYLSKASGHIFKSVTQDEDDALVYQ